MTCPTCPQTAKFQDYRPRRPVSLFGPLRLRRAYYYCGRCGQGLCPWDQTVGLTAKGLTPAAEQLVSLAGLLGDSFEEAAKKILPQMAALRLSESTTQRTTEAVGQRWGTWLDAGKTLGRKQSWDWHRDAHGRRCAYVSIDGILVPQQAPGGGPAESRQAYVALVYNAVPEQDRTPADGPKPRQQARYLAGVYTLEQLGPLLRRQAAQVGMEAAEQWIGLTDGGNGLEEFLRGNCNRADLVLILDFWHAASYLEELAGLLYPQDAARAAEQAQAWCHTMKHEGGQAILDVVQALALPKRRPALAAKHGEVVRYLGNNVHRMDYPRYRAAGWQIGSGSVESACKTVVGQRLKLAGMRWRERGTDEVCHLRALFKSEPDQWEAFWRRSVN